MARSLLLDTHVLIWWLLDDEALSDDTKDRIDTELEVYASPASVWEIAIKRSSGKLQAPPDLVDWILSSGVSELPIRHVHAAAAGDLPAIHRDPFDRLLIAQARTEGLTLATRDSVIQKYDVSVLAV